MPDFVGLIYGLMGLTTLNRRLAAAKLRSLFDCNDQPHLTTSKGDRNLAADIADRFDSSILDDFDKPT